MQFLLWLLLSFYNILVYEKGLGTNKITKYHYIYHITSLTDMFDSYHENVVDNHVQSLSVNVLKC